MFHWDNQKKEAAACRELLDGPNPNDKMTVVWIDSGDPHFFYGEIQFSTNKKTRENEKNGAEWRFTCKWYDTVVLICGRIFSRWFSNSAVFVNCVYTRSASANICFFSSIFHLVLMLRAQKWGGAPPRFCMSLYRLVSHSESLFVIRFGMIFDIFLLLAFNSVQDVQWNS